MYREMLLIRRFEEASARAYAAGKIGGFCHLYIGQEAVGVGSINAINASDYVVSTYRDHGHAIVKDLDVKALMAELFGKRSGVSGGKGGSMHFFDKEKNFMGGHGIVGGHVALAAGIGWASKYRNDKTVTLCFFGEGAANIGAFHEALNLASLWKLPVVFICENNLYSMGTPMYRALSVEDVSIRAVAYNMAKDNFIGDDVTKVKERVQLAVDRARKGEGPTLLEITTYRFRGHSMSDPAKYRTKDEVEEYKKRDPLNRAKLSLLMSGVDEKDLSRMEAEVKSQIEEAVDFAEKSEVPSASDLFSNVYAD
ncbi:MAG: pyruvate dehydrogenase (acetyl-transferring) E1 component subunit alpha [Spirochaetia bacterium]|nr:pyruvate dehydrogenase (acetyl-transferring) E1 component subunit alpha [Spirochaetia bacterium]